MEGRIVRERKGQTEGNNVGKEKEIIKRREEREQGRGRQRKVWVGNQMQERKGRKKNKDVSITG